MNPHQPIITLKAAMPKKPMRLIAPLILALGFLAATCAKVVAPPGGPEDKTPPAVLSAQPHSHQTQVPPGNSFTVSFSENINPRSVTNQFFVSPRQLEPPKIKIRGQELEAVFIDSFALDQTYVITLGSGIRDMRGNQLGDSKSFAFTRGDEIDTSFIAGTVTNEDSPANGVAVALFRKFTPESIGELDSLYPDYFTMSGKDGSFELAFLPVDEYFILAFKDKDNNQLFQYGVEDFGITTKELHIGSQSYDNLELRMQVVDTAETTIISALFNMDKLLKVNLSRRLNPTLFAGNLNHIHLLSAFDSSLVMPPKAFNSATRADTKKFDFYFPDIATGEYLLAIDFDSLYFDGRQTEKQIVEVKFSNALDIRKPTREASAIKSIIAPWETPQWLYSFSEPVTLDSSIREETELTTEPAAPPSEITNSRLDKVPYEFSATSSPYELEVSAPIRPVKGESYQLTFDVTRILDLSGNALADSVISDSILIWPTDSLGLMRLKIANKFDTLYAGKYLLKMSRLKGRDYWTSVSNPDSVAVELPSGDYILEVLIDSSQNAQGSLYPLRFATPRSFYPDTVHVRPRFDTEGITITLE